MERKQINVIVFVNVILFGGLLGVSYGLIELHGATIALSEQLDRRLASNTERIDAVEALLSGFSENTITSGRALSPSNSNEDGGVSIASIEQRLGSIEQTVASLLALKEQELTESSIEEELTENEENVLLPEQPVAASKSIIMIYDEEWGQSDWGEASATAISDAFPNEPFFSKYGGDLFTECRQTTCKVEWLMPNFSSLTPRAREEMLAMTHYELLALAAQHAENVGQMTLAWKLENKQPGVAIFFERRRQAQ